MKAKLGRMTVAVLALVWINSLLAQDIVFTNKIVTFTNTEGRVYKNVLLTKAKAEGIIWKEGDTGVGGGMVPYTKLSPGTLRMLGIPVERIEQAKVRAEDKAAAAAAVQTQPATADDALLKQIGETAAKMLPEQPEGAASNPGQITGAFGLKLGQVFDLRYATSTNSTSTLLERRGKSVLCDTRSYDFNPRHPLPHFLHYSVDVTPCSNFVYEVTAISDDFDYGSDALHACDKLLVVLEEKYGPSRLMVNGETTYYTFDRENKELSLSCVRHANENSFLILRYTDPVLALQAKTEYMRLNEADPAGKAERDRLKKQL
jgi:hypothetical protein